MKLTEFIKFFEKKNKIKILPQQKAMLEMMDGKHGIVVMRKPTRMGTNTVKKIWEEYDKQR